MCFHFSRELERTRHFFFIRFLRVLILISRNYLLRLCLYEFRPKNNNTNKNSIIKMWQFVWKQTHTHSTTITMVDNNDDNNILKSLVSKICCIVSQLLIIRYISIAFHFSLFLFYNTILSLSHDIDVCCRMGSVSSIPALFILLLLMLHNK